MTPLRLQSNILLIVIILTSFITACAVDSAPYSPANNLTTGKQLDPNTIKLALAQKIMLDFRYYCPEHTPVKNKPQTCKKPMTQLPPELAKIITDSNIGGIILFGDNLQNTSQIVKLTQDLQLAAARSSSGIPLFISVDQEGGRVARLPRHSSTAFNGNMAVGATYKKYGTKYANIVGDIQGKELSAVGVNVNHAPNVDVNINPDNPVINVRSYGEDPKQVAQLAVSHLTAMQKHNVIGTLKHFPGHGDTNVDSHTGLPKVDHSLAKIKQVDLAPFQYAIDQNQVDMIMTAHIQYPELDNSTFVSKSGQVMTKPATMSKKILTDLLREDMGYQGLIITDALDMRGISAFFSETEAVIETFNAGADIALMPLKIRFKQDLNKLDKLLTQLSNAIASGKLNSEQTLTSFKRILSVKKKYIFNSKASVITDSIEATRILANDQHRASEQELSDNAITVIKSTKKNNVTLPSDINSLHLLMPDQSKCNALINALNLYKPRLVVTCSSILTSEQNSDLAKIKNADAVLAASITPFQSIAEMGSLDDMTAFKEKFGYVSANKKRLANKLKQLLIYAKKQNKHTIFVSLRMPYEVKQYRDYADSIIATYSYNQYLDSGTNKLTSPVYNSLAKLLTGDITPTGSLPISIK